MIPSSWMQRLAADVSLKPNLYIDFEFNRIEQRYVNLVCVSLRLFGETCNIWLHNDKAVQIQFAMTLRNLLSRCRMVCYGAIAESRCLISLGMSPIEYDIVDLWAEMKQLQNGNDSAKYGRYFDYMGKERCSVPPHVIPAMNAGKDMRPIGSSYVDACALFLGVNVSQVEKDECRTLILEDRPEYSEDQANRIMKYCASDVQHLPALYSSMSQMELNMLDIDPEVLQSVHETRGRQSASMAICEAEGIPLDLEAVQNLSENADEAIDAAIRDLVENVYPFFEQIDGTWKQTYTLFEKFIKDKGLDSWWPRTPTGNLQSTEEVLDDNDYIPEIKALKDTRKVIGQIKWFRGEAWDQFFSAVDIYEDRLRCWLNPFGTQTNRNAPPASKFIPAMSNWLRCLIKAPKGWAITGADWSSQEFMIGAVLSEDPKMMAAYASGDPYAAFAKEAGAIPWDAIGEWIKDPSLAPEDQREKYQQFESTRGLFKSTVLGLQYGMGPDKLARKLSYDTKRTVTVAEATKLREMHKRVFCVYWAWQDRIWAQYSQKPLTLDDGWTLFMDNRNGLSVKNFPVQGTGSVIMRNAVIRAQKAGVKVLFPLHDAIYILHPEGSDSEIETLLRCMDEAVKEVLGKEITIRNEAKTFRWNETWVEKKGKKMYTKLSPYLAKRWLREDEERALREEKEREAYEKLHPQQKKTRKSKKTIDMNLQM